MLQLVQRLLLSPLPVDQNNGAQLLFFCRMMKIPMMEEPHLNVIFAAAVMMKR